MSQIRKVPGPGSYEPNNKVYSHIGGIVGKDLKESLIMSKTPGPGNYEHEANFKEKSPNYSLSKSARDYSPSAKYNLGPGQYDPLNGYKKVIDSAPSYNIANNAEKLKYDLGKVPGPGSYERELMKSRKSVKIAEKIKDMPTMNVPGPGVSHLLSSHTNSSASTTSPGCRAAEGTRWLRTANLRESIHLCQDRGSTRTSRPT